MMVRRLRMKFIVLSMLSVAVVLAVLLGIINAANYRRVAAEADQALKMIADNKGRFPEPKLFQDKDMGRGEWERKGRRRKKRLDMSPELPYELRYFSVLLDVNGEIIETDIGKVAAVDAETAAGYAKDAAKFSGETGFFGNYRCRKQKEGENLRVIFLDCRRTLSVFRTFLAASIAVSFAGMAAVFLLVFLLSGKAVRPFIESYEKQKRFITDAGHEIKTPLTIIDADAAVLEMECGENEWLSDIQKQTERLKELTDDLIFLSKMEEGAGEEHWIDFPVSEVAAETAQSFELLAKSQNKHLQCQIEPGLSYRGDERNIRRLFSVLLDNGVKYSEDGGEITFSLQKKGKKLVLSVLNRAEDMDGKKAERLFERFYRGDPSRNSGTGGHGIGLSIAKAIVEGHKGKIAAEVKAGEMLEITAVL